MNSHVLQRVFVASVKQPSTRETARAAGPGAALELSVIFTSEKGSQVALRFAGTLAQNLNAHLNLIVVKQVPWALPLDRPSVPVSFTERRLIALAVAETQGQLDTTVRLYYCRKRTETLLQALEPKSLIVIGCRNDWWPFRERRLARLLRSNGHQVIFAG
jgi:hypothetical protein